MTSPADLLHAGYCPHCGRGPWRSVAHHAAKKHGIDARRLREDAGLPWSAPLADPDVLETLAQRGRDRQAGKWLNAAPRGDTGPASLAGEAARLAVITGPKARRAPAKIPRDAGPVIQARIDAGERLRDIGATWGAGASAVSRFMSAWRRATGAPHPKSDLLDTAGVAAMLGVARETVSRYRYRDPTFPLPDVVLSGRPGWREATIRAWVVTRPGRTGRPRKTPGVTSTP